MVALGAGVTNRQSGQPGHIRTTIDQTALLNDVCLLEKGRKRLFQPVCIPGKSQARTHPGWCRRGNLLTAFFLNTAGKRS